MTKTSRANDMLLRSSLSHFAGDHIKSGLRFLMMIYENKPSAALELASRSLAQSIVARPRLPITRYYESQSIRHGQRILRRLSRFHRHRARP